MGWTYLLQCNDDSYYVGSTRNLDRRMEQHASGFGSAYTARRRPVRLMWAQEFESVAEAYAMEKRIQGWGRAKREALIQGRFEDLPALAKKPRKRRPRTDSAQRSVE